MKSCAILSDMAQEYYTDKRVEFAELGALVFTHDSEAWPLAVAAILESYSCWLDAVFSYCLKYRATRLKSTSVLEERYKLATSLNSKLAIIIGLAGRQVIEQLMSDNITRVHSFNFVRKLPVYSRDVLWQLLNDAKLLPTIAQVFGKHVEFAHGINHYFHLCQDDLDLCIDTALCSGQKYFGDQYLLSKLIDSVPWCRQYSSSPQLNHNYSSQELLISLHYRGPEYGAIAIIPGSHRHRAGHSPGISELRRKKLLTVGEGDLILLDSTTFRTHYSNRGAGQGNSWLALTCRQSG